MQTVEAVVLNSVQVQEPFLNQKVHTSPRLRPGVILLLFVLVFAAFFVRAYHLGAAGLSEDETHKVFAVRAYAQGDFASNAEHPMLMKMLCARSLEACEIWNRIAGDRPVLAVSEEAAIRLPNALFGALTVVPLFLLAQSLFGFRIGVITSILWTLGLNAVWFNRIAKEDTLLVFFMLTAFYLYNLAKNRPERDERTQERLYGFAGAAFGLMLSSKYFPHYIGLFQLYYYLAAYDSKNNRPLTRRMWVRHYGALFGTLLVFNFAIFAPDTWRYLWSYLSEDLQTHHGYIMMGRLYPNEISDTPAGTPWYFYWLYLAVKLPLPLLAMFLAGAVDVFRRRNAGDNRRGYLFLRVMLFAWLVPMCIVGSKFLRYTLGLIPFVYMAAAIGAVLIDSYLRGMINRLSDSHDLLIGLPRRALTAGCRTALVVIVALPALALARYQDSPGLFTNSIGGNRIGWFFPHDEFYDLGARESIKFLAESAPPGSIVASEIPGVMQYYLARFNRQDITSIEITEANSDASRQADFTIVQPGRVYFENRNRLAWIKKACPLLQSSSFEGEVTSAVYFTGSNIPNGE
ncbi:MAG: hypothetical protein DMF61_14080 [Blastocatellia bacterium AA13]|nr:MAG: hypothetical protein DMF61_14080 [Blastocatellia bacterium AA13]